MNKAILCVVVVFSFVSSVMGLDAVRLPEPVREGGPTLSGVLSERRTRRDFVDEELTSRQLSDLLWSTAGVNRVDGRMVYPTAMNRQDMLVYVVTRGGVYRYEARENVLRPVREGDFRAETGMQPFVGRAAVNLAYVQDMKKWSGSAEELARGKDWGFAHAGEMTQNGYLYAAGQGWGSVVRGMFDAEVMRELLMLGEGEEVRLVHSIGPCE